MTLRKLCGRLATASAVALCLVGCTSDDSTAEPLQSATTGLPALSTLATSEPVPVAAASVQASQSRAVVSESVGEAIALWRLSEDYAPRTDVFLDYRARLVAEAADLRVPARMGAAPGPVHGPTPTDPKIEALLGRAFNMCDDRQAYEAIMHVPFQTGGLLRLRDYNHLQDMRPHMGCDGPPPDTGVPTHRYGYVYVDGNLGFAESALEARAASAQSVQAEKERWKDTLYGGADALGAFAFNHSEYRETRFAPADAPVDALRVLPESIKVRNGVLRGLVRNWSRNLFAYGTTVTADGRSWRWPLSVQPGETAPFEIEGWDGPVEPGQIRFTVDAEMSPEIDISRSWFIDYPHQARKHNAQSLRRFGYTDAVVERVPATGSFAFYPSQIYWELEPPSRDRPLVRNNLFDYWDKVNIKDLRAYAVDLDDQHGRVLEVKRLPVYAEEHKDAVRIDGKETTRWVLASSYPHAATADAAGRTYIDVNLHIIWHIEFDHPYEIGNRLIWVGGAHPQAAED